MPDAKLRPTIDTLLERVQRLETAFVLSRLVERAQASADGVGGVEPTPMRAADYREGLNLAIDSMEARLVAEGVLKRARRKPPESGGSAPPDAPPPPPPARSLRRIK